MDVSNLFEVIKQSGQLPYIDFVKKWSLSTIQSTTESFESMSRNGFVFKQYKNLEEAFDLLEKTKNIPTKSRIESSALSNVTGSEFKDFKAYNDYINTDDSTFTKIKDISKVLVENIKTLINLGGLFENDKIIITQDERGIFDFGLASLGLYRPIEFYSEALKDDIKNGVLKNPFEFVGLEPGVINPDNVNKRTIAKLTFFKYSINGKDYDCERRQRGATKVFNYFPKDCFLKPNEDGITLTYYIDNQSKVFNGKDNIRLKYASSNKKSYLIYNKKDDSVKNVDIFMPINFLAVNDSTRAIMLWPPYLICAALEEFGIKTRLSALRLGSDKSTQITVSIPVKDYEESTKLSFNRIFALLSKSNTASSFFAFHKIIVENEGIQATATGDTSSSFSDVEYDKRTYMNEIMQRYKNWCEVNKEKDFVNTKVVNNNFQFALPTTRGTKANNQMEYNDIFKNIHQIFFTFYYYMDFLAIEMLPMQTFIKNINKRFIEDVTFRKLFEIPSTSIEIKNVIRIYVISILVEKYKLVSQGKYSDTLEQKNKKEESFAEKVKLLNESLDSI